MIDLEISGVREGETNSCIFTLYKRSSLNWRGVWTRDLVRRNKCSWNNLQHPTADHCSVVKASCHIKWSVCVMLCRQAWNHRRKMFCLQLCLRLQTGTGVCAVTRQAVHKLASLQNVTSLPPMKMQSSLYPFSGLESYLAKYCGLYIVCLIYYYCCTQINLLFSLNQIF